MNNAAEEEIRARIDKWGRITFAEFMDLALYHPTGGYYCVDSPIGARGDYYTSPTAHPAFGAAITVMLQNMWEALGRPSPFHVVEMGAGDGLLTRDIAAFAPILSDNMAQNLRYTTLARTSRSPVYGLHETSLNQIITTGVPLRDVVGCMLSNELVDAFPVAQFEVREGIPQEVYVALSKEEYHEVLDYPSTPELIQALAGLNNDLPEGYRGEIGVGVATWVEEVSHALTRGFVITIDYGYANHDTFPLDRREGTLRTHRGHTSGNDPLHHIGAQDITAHVDFTAIDQFGKKRGLNGLDIVSQARLLRTLGLNHWLHDLRKMSLSQGVRDANMMAMRDIVSPGGLGDFGILVQEKNTGILALEQILPTSDTVLPPPPLLDSTHTPLLEGRYPHTTWNLPQIWDLP